MISSAMLPNVALRIPPTWGPVSAPSRSVARPTIQARPRIAAAETTKTADPSTWSQNSRTTARPDSPSVTRTATRATGDRAPRTGIRDGAAGGCSMPAMLLVLHRLGLPDRGRLVAFLRLLAAVGLHDP